MQSTLPLACFLSMIRPPGVQFENSLLQIAPVDKAKCPFVRENNDIGYHLYTRLNPTVHQDLQIGDDEALFASSINFHDPTVIYFHAFMENPDDGSAIAVREAYVHRGDTNVIMVDASRLEAGPWYFTAAENTWYIGQFTAKFLDYLVSRGLDLSKTHLVGHSLGAQAAGVAGSALKSGRVSRITGLDPALPLFSKLPLEQRLDPSDAEFVDVIHTDAGIFGVHDQTGHVDFYPNGGISPQPGCELEVVFHQQQLLNKCDKNAKPKGFYIYYLTPKNHKTQAVADTPIKKLLTYILNGNLKGNYMNNKEKRTDLNSKKEYSIQNLIKESVNKSKNFLSEYKISKNELRTLWKVVRLLRRRNSRKTSNGIVDKISDSLFVKNSLNGLFADQTDDLTAKITETIQNSNNEIKKRQKRFLPFFRNTQSSENNLLFRMLEFLMRNRKNVVPVFTVMREINTLVKSANGELMHALTERNNYIGPSPSFQPITYNLELGTANENGGAAFVKRLLGFGGNGDRLSVVTSGR